MATKYVVLVIVVAYIALWAFTSHALGRDEEDEKMKSLWWMFGMFWPMVWVLMAVSFIVWLFSKNERDLR